MAHNDNDLPSIDDLITSLSSLSTSTQEESYQSLSDELLALQSIYAGAVVDDGGAQSGGGRGGEEAVTVVRIVGDTPGEVMENASVELMVRLPLDVDSVTSSSSSDKDSQPSVARLAIHLPPRYPSCDRAPTLQILDRFLGAWEVDEGLKRSIGRIVSAGGDAAADGGVEWRKGEVVLFEALEQCKELIEAWFARQEETKRSDAETEAEAREANAPAGTPPTPLARQLAPRSKLPFDPVWHSTPASVDRKSTFIGHCLSLPPTFHPSMIPAILQTLHDLPIRPSLDKATHPFIYAYHFREPPSPTPPSSSSSSSSNTANGGGGTIIIHRDCDDDGETAAGGRLAHLLEMSKVADVLVVVSRWFGGVHLGADRFKWINRVGREALGLVVEQRQRDNKERGRGGGSGGGGGREKGNRKK